MNFSVPGTAMAAPSILMSPMSPVLRSIAHLTFSLTALVACILKRSGKIRSLRFFADALDLLTIIKFQGSQPFLEGLALLLSFFVFFHTVSMTDFHQPGGDYFLSVKFFFRFFAQLMKILKYFSFLAKSFLHSEKKQKRIKPFFSDFTADNVRICDLRCPDSAIAVKNRRI